MTTFANSRLAVVKVGTSSVTDSRGALDESALGKLAVDLARARAEGWKVVLVLSGAVAAGMPALGLDRRPTDMSTLQAIAAVGQPRLVGRMSELLAPHGIVAGQVLLDPYDFLHRSQYLHARDTLGRLLDLGVLPVVNENDTVADDEIRFGDNDRLAALVAHLLGAEVLVLLTDTPGLFTADPRLDAGASLIAEIVEVDTALEAVAGGTGSARGSGGMTSKLQAAKIAAWSGVRAVIAAAASDGVIVAALAGRSVGTTVQPRAERLAARKLWIAFAQAAEGRVVVDDGARRALVESGRSLLPAGIRAVEGTFDDAAAVEVVGPDGAVFAKGLVRMSGAELRQAMGKRSSELPEELRREAIHRDDLVVLP